MHPYLISLCRDYCECITNMSSGHFNRAELHELDSQRQIIHNQILQFIGKDRGDSLDIHEYARSVVMATRGGNYQ